MKTTAVNSTSTCSLSSVCLEPEGSTDVTEVMEVPVHTGETPQAFGDMEENLDTEGTTSSPSFVISKNLPVASSTPKVLRKEGIKKCNKCPGKSKKIKKWKRRHKGLNKRFKKLKKKYTERKNRQVQ